MTSTLLISTMVLAPLVGFLINGFGYKNKNGYLAGTIATSAMAISFTCAVFLFFQLVGLPVDQRTLRADYFTWMQGDSLEINMAFVVDQISAIMILVITGVGTLIHMFSIAYMSHDSRPAKYFAYLNLFVVNMLILVLGANLVVMFVGWEGVGLCSYLLIGFWFKDKEKAAAGMKAFIVNRIGDAGLLLGMFILFTQFGTLEFDRIISYVASATPEATFGPLTFATLLLFVGATGKSAQIPLYVWLPDAMAGPTPVSALIHAATMVTAGVYMIVRLSALFVATPTTMFVVAVVGAATALMAATIGMTQFDIKKVLAYSTVSQLGYMFLACGVGAFGPAMFHLMTHAFFKALMFLGSGSVIHAMSEEQDIRKMGGLKKYLPITHWTFVMGWLAIIGTPLFSGFFSKDEILWLSLNSPRGGFLFWLAGILGAMLTGFYMTRLMALTFWGKSRVPSSTHPHESPPLMTIPLIVLAVLSVIGGWIGLPHVLGHAIHLPNFLEGWLEPKLAVIPGMHASSAAMEVLFMGISVALVGLSVYLAQHLYLKAPQIQAKLVAAFPKTHQFVYQKFLVDEFYFSKVVNPIVNLSKGLWVYIDVNLIDKTTHVVSGYVKSVGDGLRSLQNGNLQQYALYLALGVVFLFSIIIF